MQQDEPPGGAVALKLNSDTRGSAQSPGAAPIWVPNPVQTQNLDQNHTSQTEDQSPDQSPAQVQSNPEMNPVTGLTQSPGSDSAGVPNPVQTSQTEEDPSLPQGPAQSPAQGPAQSIVVRVPALALIKALVQSSGKTQVRIPLQTGGPVLVPSAAHSHIRLTASVQTRSPSPGTILSPTRSQSLGPGQALVRPPQPSLLRGPGGVQNQNQVTAQVQPRTQIQIQVRDTVPSLVQKQVQTNYHKMTVVQRPDVGPEPVLVRIPLPPEAVRPLNPLTTQGLDQGPDPVLVRIPLPPEAVRPLSPPLSTTPMKPSVPPLGFRLNGRLIPLLPGKDGLEVSLRSHPGGSRSSLTSLHLNEAPPPRPSQAPPPRPSQALPPRMIKRKAPPPVRSPSPKIITTPPARVTSHKPRPSPKLRPQKPKVATLLQKEMIPAPPQDCPRCLSHFNPVPELRGFICMCSPELSSSLQTLKLKRKDERMKFKLKKLNQRRKMRPRSYSPTAASKSPLSLQKPLRAPGHFLSEPHPSAQVSPAGPSPLDRCGGVSVGGAQGRLVIRLEDFYYGSSEGHVGPQRRQLRTYRCLNCPKTLRNNVRLMNHMMDHVTDGGESSCRHCLRQIVPLYRLQRHLEAVHRPDSSSSTVVCQICERDFETEISLLVHMKSTHKPGEMPYACELCGFRSSFFARTWRHFEEVHVDTKHFLCHYCLRVFKADHAYQQHVARHQRKQVYSCDRCRLHFLSIKDRQEHQELLHQTHHRPEQLSGLRPGTTVTVRTFQAVGSVCAVQTTPGAALAESRAPRKSCKRKAVKSLGELLAHLDTPGSVCVECQCRVQDFQSHFPSTVLCSRCRFQTSCSRAYANHMINNHSANRKQPLYPCVFAPSPSQGGAVECLTCGFSTHSGDAMAQHLSTAPKHTCLLTGAEEEEEEPQSTEEGGGARGGFVSVECLQSSSHLSIKVLNRPAHLSSPVAMMITMTGPTPRTKPSPSLSVSRLRVLLDFLLGGSGGRSFGVSQKLIGCWTQEQRKALANRRWRWDTTGGARWVLTEREQNRAVTADAILDLSRRTLGPKSSLQTRLNWAVDFLLRHDLGLESRSKELRDLGSSVVSSTWDQVLALGLPPPRFCCLDEFPVFLDPGALWSPSPPSPEALRLWAEGPERPLVEVMLCGASDGSLLRPLLFYEKHLPPLPHGFPTNVLLLAKETGFSPRERAHIWTHQVWAPHLGHSHAPSLLLLDEHSGHMTQDFLEPLQRSCTELVHVPAGCGFVVQPLDQCVAPVLRQFIKVFRLHRVEVQNCRSFSSNSETRAAPSPGPNSASSSPRQPIREPQTAGGGAFPQPRQPIRKPGGGKGGGATSARPIRDRGCGAMGREPIRCCGAGGGHGRGPIRASGVDWGGGAKDCGPIRASGGDWGGGAKDCGPIRASGVDWGGGAKDCGPIRASGGDWGGGVKDCGPIRTLGLVTVFDGHSALVPPPKQEDVCVCVHI